MRRIINLAMLMLFVCQICTDSGVILAQSDKKAQEIVLVAQNERLSQVFKRLEKLTSYKIMFATEDVSKYSFSGTVRAKNIHEAMQQIIGNKPLEYAIDRQFIHVTAKGKAPGMALVVSKGSILHGTIVDENDLPLIGATVSIKGKGEGTTTNLDGEYTLITKETSGTIVFSYVGYEPQEYPMAQAVGLKKIQLKSATHLDDVVITGIFQKAKESYTGSVSTVTEEQLDMYRGQNLLQTLKNIDASINFQMDNLNGSNPNNIPSINIRGNASLPTDLQEFNETQKNTVNTPLIIMDGFEITLTKLMDYNDDEIKSINILKDAAATAIYGSRGANGVIVVITKEPQPGKLRMNVELGMTFEVPDLSSYDVLNAADKLALEKAAGLYTSDVPTTQTTYDTEYNRRLKMVLSGIDTDWMAKPLHTGVGQRYNLRLEGGSEEFRWSATAAYTNTQGAMKDSERRNFNGSITLMYRVKSLIFRNYTSVGVNRSTESKYGTFSEYVSMLPYYSPYDEEGNLIKSWNMRYNSTGIIGNPLYDASLGSFDKSDYQDVTNNFSVEWRPIDELIIRGQLGISSTQNTANTFVSPYDSQFDDDEYQTEEGMLRKGTYQYGSGRDFSYDANLTASYTKTFNDVHQLYAGLDLSLSESKSKMNYFNMEGYSTDNVRSLAMAMQYAADSAPTATSSFYRRMGVTANANYTYDNRYYVDLSYRMDGNSNFGSEKKYAPFWSVGAGWSLHNEKFLKENEAINNLRLKLSYGQTGTQLTSSSGAVTYYKYVTDEKYLNWNSAVMQGYGNKNLTWQTTNEFNLGIEWGFWNNRLKGSLDIYTKKTKDLLSYMDMPLSTGFSSYLANVGSVKNVGFEASLSGYVIRDAAHDFNWMLSGQLVYNKNEITELSEDIQAQNEAYLSSDSDVEIANLLQVGRPQNAIYGVRSLGIDPSTGDELYLDKDGNVTNEWKTADMVYLGQTDPKYRGVLSSLINWKNFSLNVSFNFHWGGQMYNSTLRDRVEVTLTTLANYNVDARALSDRWLQVGDVTFFRRFSDVTGKASSRYVMDDNVLELSSVSLQYRWDSNWLKKQLPVQSIIFGVNMSDLFYWSSVKVERGTNYPFARNIQGSVKFMF